jgi:hypothetical protein
VLEERGGDVTIVGGIAVEDTVVRDKAAATLGEKHLVAKLDRALGTSRA